MAEPCLPADSQPLFDAPRARSNTWPNVQPEGVKTEEAVAVAQARPAQSGAGAGQRERKATRRNAWGSMSYAELITRAIQSSPEKRRTLNQIYEWMVENVAYFKDKGDTNSSAGWKVGPLTKVDCLVSGDKDVLQLSRIFSFMILIAWAATLH